MNVGERINDLNGFIISCYLRKYPPWVYYVTETETETKTEIRSNCACASVHTLFPFIHSSYQNVNGQESILYSLILRL